MSDASIPAGTMSILREVMDAWINRNARKAAAGAGQLTFWRDGMLAQLEAIEREGPKPELVKELKANFEESKERVEEAIDKLKVVRSKIGPTKIGRQLDAVLHHNTYGKTGIREDIELLIAACEVPDLPEEHRELNNHNIKNDAAYLRRQIDAFNGEVAKLMRLAKPE